MTTEERHFPADVSSPGMRQSGRNMFTPTPMRMSDSTPFVMSRASPEAVLLSQLQDKFVQERESMSPEKIAASQMATSAAVVEAQKEMANMLREQTEMQNRFHLELLRTDHLANVVSLPADGGETGSNRKTRRTRKKNAKHRKRARVHDAREKGIAPVPAYSSGEEESAEDSREASGGEDTHSTASSERSSYASNSSSDADTAGEKGKEDNDDFFAPHSKRRRKTPRRNKSARPEASLAAPKERTGANVSQAALLHAEMKARIEQLESDQLRSRLALLEGRMSSLTAGAAHVPENNAVVTRSKHKRVEHVFDNVSRKEETRPSERGAMEEEEERFVQSEMLGGRTGRRAGALPSARSSASSKDSHLARINARIDDLDAKVVALSPERKHPWALSDELLKEHMDTLGTHIGGDTLQSVGALDTDANTEEVSGDSPTATSAAPVSTQ